MRIETNWQLAHSTADYFPGEAKDLHVSGIDYPSNGDLVHLSLENGGAGRVMIDNVELRGAYCRLTREQAAKLHAELGRILKADEVAS